MINLKENELYQEIEIFLNDKKNRRGRSRPKRKNAFSFEHFPAISK